MRACYSTGTSSALAGQRTRPPLDLHHAALLSSPILPQLDAWISCAPSPGSVSATRSPPSYIPCATGLPDKPRTRRLARCASCARCAPRARGLCSRWMKVGSREGAAARGRPPAQGGHAAGEVSRSRGVAVGVCSGREEGKARLVRGASSLG
jgi:hypothetical protein